MEPILISYVITEFFAEVSVTDQFRITEIQQQQAILSFFTEANENLTLINNQANYSWEN
ncbi:hypothetical protein [Pedobacter africanus]|jgi:hypothetical protein|uniref:Uncharacterized protein n=1 Tax=Pedobacter africanus TaxID=151894 RepID=A0A1W1YMS1_9SPHI|nr:hypothetical protein [Pedobacter africanus]SMC37444.1 hypothetical protein SAMN04488524_0042 [Pedobacter africanus]